MEEKERGKNAADAYFPSFLPHSLPPSPPSDICFVLLKFDVVIASKAPKNPDKISMAELTSPNDKSEDGTAGMSKSTKESEVAENIHYI